ARNAIRALMADWSPGLELGLSTYGHRRKGDCGDIETLIPLGAADPQAVIAAVDGIQPKGKTPLSDAVRRAAEEMKYTEDAATVILISDGIETCDADPCAVGAALAESGVAFRAHVIGFDLDEKEQDSLRCLAENTGGQFIPAGNAASLQDALGQVVEVTVTEVQVKAEPPKPEPVAAAGMRFKALYAEGGPQVKGALSWEVNEAVKDIDGNRKRVAYSYDTEPFFELAPGAYLLSVTVGSATGTVEFEISADSPREMAVVLDAGLAAVMAKRTAGAEPIAGNLSWEVYGVDKDIDGKRKRFAYSYDNQPLFTLPAGRYLLEVTHGASGGKAEIEVEAGKRAEAEIVLDSGIAAMSAALTEGAEPIGGSLAWEVFETETDIDGKRSRVTYSYDNQPQFFLHAGEYLVVLKRSASTTEALIAVEAGQRAEIIVDMAAGILKARAEGAGGSMSWEVLNAEPGIDGKRARVSYSYDAQPEWTLPAGRYVVSLKSAGATGSTEVEIGAGKRHELVLQMQ
ncbi:MAG: hypothetical protein HOK81_08930, partial [Rhodospirillaceae bacterium]|nr:hypothetical protein [Rhodospirillaceae bacterium]